MNIIFDIDDTLLQSSEFDTACFKAAVYDVHGRVDIHDDWNAYTHVTDQGLIEQIAIENDLADARMEDVKAKYVSHVSAHLARRPLDCVATLGAKSMLTNLQPIHHIALATGGWRRVQELKLANADIATDLPMFGSDGFAPRTEIMKACHRAIANPEFATLYVGDGEWDMRASDELGWHFIGIGPRLKGVCDHWIADFEASGFLEKLAVIQEE